MSDQPDHELEELEDDTRVPPRPEEVVADAGGDDSEGSLDPEVTEQPI